jgi:hypothetical protein
MCFVLVLVSILSNSSISSYKGFPPTKVAFEEPVKNRVSSDRSISSKDSKFFPFFSKLSVRLGGVGGGVVSVDAESNFSKWLMIASAFATAGENSKSFSVIGPFSSIFIGNVMSNFENSKFKLESNESPKSDVILSNELSDCIESRYDFSLIFW